MAENKDLIGKKVTNKSRGEGTIVGIDPKGNIEVLYGDKKIKHPAFTLQNGILQIVDDNSQNEPETNTCEEKTE